MSCGQPATWIVRSHRGDEPLCHECIRYRHRGEDVSLLSRVGDAACACSHMPAKLEQDRAHGFDPDRDRREAIVRSVRGELW